MHRREAAESRAETIAADSDIEKLSISNGGASVQSSSPKPIDQKIVFTARLTLVVEKFDEIPAKITKIAEQFGGYISEANVGEMYGSQRQGTWRIRVPSDRFRAMLEAAVGLGVTKSVTENAEDVSEKYVDLEARITSAKRLENQIAKLLEKQDNRLENMISLERELSRVRLEIEQMEGALRLLSNKVAYSTIHLSVEERMAFVPPQNISFQERIDNEWSSAVGGVQRLGESLAIFFVSNAFVLAGWIIAALVAYPFIRRLIRKTFANLRSASVAMENSNHS